MIISKFLPIDQNMINSVPELLEMGYSSNRTFLLGFICLSLHCLLEEFWQITYSILTDGRRSSYSFHSSYTKNIIIILEVILWNGFDKQKTSTAYVRNTNISIYKPSLKTKYKYIFIGNITYVFVSNIHPYLEYVLDGQEHLHPPFHYCRAVYHSLQ